MTFHNIGLAILIIVMLVVLVRTGRRERESVRALRAAIFEPCLPCFGDYRITQDGPAFPILQGRMRGRQLLLEPIADALVMRKLPVLWLRLTLLEPLRIDTTLSLLVRPQGTEFWSPSAELPHRLPLPAGWPEHALLRSDQPEVQSLLARLNPHVLEYFADMHAKELAISPRGVRLVYQLDQARRSNYLVLRTALFDHGFVAPELLSALVNHASAIHEALAGSCEPARVNGA